MPSRRAALALPIAACGGGAPPAGPPPALSAETAIIAAEAWHTDLCLPAAALREGPLSPVLAETPGAAGLAVACHNVPDFLPKGSGPPARSFIGAL
jgi:hypothetical protein